jgi:hypothetical protein
MNLDTQYGLNTPTEAEIIAAFVLQINTYIDASFAITNTSLLSQIIVICSDKLNDLFETLTVCFDVLDPSTATGDNLVDACKYVGVSRGEALATQVFLLLTSETEVDFPKNTQLTSGQFTIKNNVAIPILADSCAQCKITVTEAVESAVYSFELNDILVSYTAAVSDTIATIATALAEQTPLDAPLFIAEVDSGDTSSFIINATTDGVLDYAQSFSVSVNTGDIIVGSISAYGQFFNSETGNITIPAETFNLESTPISGVSSLQPEAGINGQDQDTDQDLRIKRDLSLSVGGARTNSAIRSALLATNYVKKAQVYQNRLTTPEPITETLDLLGNSIYAVVLGGYKVDIANSIYRKMSEGIQTNGETVVTLYDDFKNPIFISFDYAEQIPVAVQISVMVDKSLLYKINKNASANAKAAVFQNIQGLNIGETMYVDDLISAVWAQIGYGIKSAGTTITYQKLPSETNYTADLVVEANQVVTCSIANISITVIAE